MSVGKTRQELATEIRLELQVNAGAIFSQTSAHSWVKMYICQEAIEDVLAGVESVLDALNLSETSLALIPPSDLAPCWAELMRQHGNVSWREEPDIYGLQCETIRAVASAVHASAEQNERNRKVRHNCPAGVKELPELSSGERNQTGAVPWSLVASSNITGKKNTPSNFTEYMHCISRIKRQVTSGRASLDTPLNED